VTEDGVVLVADDEEDILTLVGTVLRGAGFEVVEARDGAEALSLARERAPRAAVLDVSMPELDGLEVLQRLRDAPETRDVPVILLSALAQEADVARGYDAGAARYIRKPFKPAELVAAVRDVLS
jgi:DNA-binding response OmpR family regulator